MNTNNEGMLELFDTSMEMESVDLYIAQQERLPDGNAQGEFYQVLSSLTSVTLAFERFELIEWSGIAILETSVAKFD